MSNNTKWQEQYIEELKKEIEYNRNIHINHFTHLCRRNDPETLKEIELITNPFDPNRTPKPRYSYKVGDVLFQRWNFNVARIVAVLSDWYIFDRAGMCDTSRLSTQVHKNSVEPEHCMRKVDIDLPLNVTEEKYEVSSQQSKGT